MDANQADNFLIAFRRQQFDADNGITYRYRVVIADRPGGAFAFAGLT
ncbi:hypothetical protein [Candidatus Sodalis sp. SoCistrobi]|nr:hypothetical protein [Candidatus Sodalis sp. SoCistrobi]